MSTPSFQGSPRLLLLRLLLCCCRRRPCCALISAATPAVAALLLLPPLFPLPLLSTPLRLPRTNAQTSTTSWSLIWSVPEALAPYQNCGAMLATEPWSGHYYVDGTIYMHAHWTQFAQIGWHILCVG
jgi:hypothetical protein